VADLLNADVDLIFYDTTSLHFEVDEEDQGDADGLVQGSRAAGAKEYKAPRKRGKSKNGRGGGATWSATTRPRRSANAGTASGCWSWPQRNWPR
jgi:hypothetical protein